MLVRRHPGDATTAYSLPDTCATDMNCRDVRGHLRASMIGKNRKIAPKRQRECALQSAVMTVSFASEAEVTSPGWPTFLVPPAALVLAAPVCHCQCWTWGSAGRFSRLALGQHMTFEVLDGGAPPELVQESSDGSSFH